MEVPCRVASSYRSALQALCYVMFPCNSVIPDDWAESKTHRGLCPAFDREWAENQGISMCTGWLASSPSPWERNAKINVIKDMQKHTVSVRVIRGHRRGEKSERRAFLFAFKCMRSLRPWHCAEVCPTSFAYCLCPGFDLSRTYRHGAVRRDMHALLGGGEGRWRGNNADRLRCDRGRGRWRTKNWKDKNRTIEGVHKA